MPGNTPGRRRANAEGTIYYDERRKLWRARYVLANGRRPEVSAKTQKACREKLAAALRDRDAGLPTPDQRQTVGEFLAYWLDEEAPARLRPGTLDDYRSIVRVHIAPEVGRVRLVNLRPEHVQRLLNGLTAAGKSAATVTKVRAVLRRALGRAMALGRVARNVAALVDPPPTSRDPVTVPPPAQVAALLAAFDGHDLGDLVMLAITTGLRRGELLGLTWGDLELEHVHGPRLHVRYQLQRVAGELQRVEPKTRSARRVVSLSTAAVEALRRQRAKQGRERLAAGGKWADTGLVFTNATGRGLDGEALYKRFRRHVAASGLPPVRWHDLRHCFASLQAAEGATLLEVRDDLGHADVRTTTIYAHVLPDARRGTAERMDRALDRKPG